MARIVLVLVIVLQVFLSSTVLAAGAGPYLGLGAGANFLAGDMENDSSSGSFNLSFETGYQGNLTLGYRLPPNSEYGKGRLEMEIGYRQNNVDKIGFSDGEFDAGGEARVWDIMLSTFGESPNDTPWTPYFGGGIGVAQISLKGVDVTGAPVLDDDDLVLAYQLGVGLDYVLSDAVVLDCGYRFFGTSTPSFKDVNGVKFDSEYYAHSIQVGIRVSF